MPQMPIILPMAKQQKPFKNEYAPGIPFRRKTQQIPNKKDVTWELTVHDHHAKRRGRHLDLRLGDPNTGHAHSWALTGKLPNPGESTWAIQQPTHTIQYMDFRGIIHDGYGAGKVDIAERGKTNIIESSNDRVKFLVNRGTTPYLYTLRRMQGNKWKLFNNTLTRDNIPRVPTYKPTYKSKKYEDLPTDNPDEIYMPKIDGAHNLIVLPKADKQVRVISYRKSKRDPTGVIEHTFKFPEMPGTKTPSGFGGTVLRAEAYAINPHTKESVEAQTLAGILNSSTPTSVAAQKSLGKLRLAPFDVVYFNGKDISSKPYGERLEILKKVVDKLPENVEIPPVAETINEKKKLVRDIKSGKIPLTREGIVVWDKTKPTPPTKYKLRPEYDVVIRDFYPGSGKIKNKAVGGFLFSHSEGGPIVGRVGTGFSEELRKDMNKHPEKYLGMIARVSGQGIYKNRGNLGAIRAPAFIDFHPDKNEPYRLDTILKGLNYHVRKQ